MYVLSTIYLDLKTPDFPHFVSFLYTSREQISSPGTPWIVSVLISFKKGKWNKYIEINASTHDNSQLCNDLINQFYTKFG